VAHPIGTIIHPTDFSNASMEAFAHAMAFSLVARCRLYILHIAKEGEDYSTYTFPQVYRLLGHWGKIGPNESPQEIEARTGVRVSKIALAPGNIRQRIDDFIASHGCDLMILSTHHRDAWRRLISSSVATGAADDSRVPTLFLRDDVTGFIDPQTGVCRLKTVLIPIGSEVSDEAVRRIEEIMSLVAPKVRFKMLHIGTQQPVVIYNEGYQRVLPIEFRPGAVVETIARSASEMGAGLIAMPTEGRHGLSDALFGTTTERVLYEASCPVLAMPMFGGRSVVRP
jgi:nucleotide-binding universal stress UspA family protein